MIRLCAAVLLAAACGPGARALPPGTSLEPGIEIAVHPEFAVVVQRRWMTLPAGAARIEFADVPASLDPGSVSVRSLTDPLGTHIRGQSFEGAVPVLVWQADVDHPGRHLLEVVYTVPDMTWRMDYALDVDVRAARLRVGGWASVHNGAAQPVAGASVRLVSGPFEHAVDAPVDLAPGETAQFALVHDARTVPAQLEVRVDALGAGPIDGAATDPSAGMGTAHAVRTHVAFEAPARLPAGTAQIHLRRNGAGQPVFAAAAPIAAAEPGQRVRVDLGGATHVRGQRVQTDFDHDLDTGRIRESIAIRVHNDGADAARVVVSDRLFRAPAVQVVDAAPPATVLDDRVEQVLTVPPGEARTAHYRAVYSAVSVTESR